MGHFWGKAKAFLLACAVALALAGCPSLFSGLRPPARTTISGKVTLATAERTPIAGAEIFVTAAETSGAAAAGATPLAQSREDGTFTISNAPAGTVELRVVPPDELLAQEGVVRMTAVRGAQNTIEVRLVPAGVVVQDVELTPHELRLAVGETYQFQFRVDTASGVSLEPTFSVVGEMGKISAGGVFTATAPGSGEVRATLGGQVATASVTCVACDVVEEPDRTPPAGSAQFSVDERGMTKVLVGLRPGVVSTQAARTVVSLRGVVTKRFRFVNALAAEVPYDRLGELANDPRVAYVEPDAQVSVRQDPNAEQVLPWGVDQVDAERVWAGVEDGLHVARGMVTGRDVKVAVVDTGIDLDHPDLEVAGGYNAINPYASYDDDMGHGTLAAGIIGARDNGIGVIGIAPECKLYAVKALDSQGLGEVSDVVRAIEWCISPTDAAGNPLPEGPMDIINLSLGVTFNSETLKQACDQAWNNPSHPHGGAILVAASGNNEPNVWPGNYGSVISVGATTRRDELADFSSTGPAVELSAPGEDVLSTLYADRYDMRSGTSFSAPHVAGVAALVYSTGRYRAAANLRQHLRDTAKDLGPPGRDELFGWGRVDALTAVVDEGCSDVFFTRALMGQ